MEESENKLILNLAAELSCGDHKSIPRLLCNIKEILENTGRDTSDLLAIKRHLWAYKIVDIIAVTLLQDFSNLLHGWDTAAQLTTILSKICCGYTPPDGDTFNKEFLPKIINDILSLASKIQTKYLKISKVLVDVREGFIANYRQCLESINRLFTGYTRLTVNVLQSPWLLQMLITDDSTTSTLIMATIHSAHRMNKSIFTDINMKSQHQITDELIYKLSATEDADLARGLRLLLVNWMDKGFDNYLNKLLKMVSCYTQIQANDKKLYLSAAKIQGLWRGHKARKELKHASNMVARLQVCYRQRKRERDQRRQCGVERDALKELLHDRRRRAIRDLRCKQLETLQAMPAENIRKYLEEERSVAAVKIQAHYRGHRTRKSCRANRSARIKLKAALTIQRCIRRWLQRMRRRRRNDIADIQRPEGLDDNRREQLQKLIEEYRAQTSKAADLSDLEKVDLYKKSQTLLAAHLMKSKQHRQQKLHLEAIAAQIDIDCSLLFDIPPLSEIDADLNETFASISYPVICAARLRHKEELRDTNKSWWRKLADLPDDSDETKDKEWRIF